MTATALPGFEASPKRFAPWLALALLVHASLLLLPLQRALNTGPAVRTISVSLWKPRPTDQASPLPSEQILSGPQARPAKPPAAPVADPWPPATATVPPSEFTPSEIKDPPPTAARLLDQARRFDWRPPPQSDPGASRLRRPTPQSSWRTAEPATPANRFDGMVAPAEVEIVDRWLAADGSHNVVIRTPSGDTYCGRAEAWNPMNPLYEPVMMYRPCGGGGKRTFEIDPERLRRME